MSCYFNLAGHFKSSMKTILLLFVFIFLSTSCNNKNTCNSELNLKFSIGTDVIIDSNNFIYESLNTYLKNYDGKNLLYRSYHQVGKIEVWDWDNKTFKKNILLPYEGPNYLNNVMAGSFYPMTKDSIFLPSISNRVGIQYQDSLVFTLRFDDHDHLLFFGSSSRQKVHQFENKFIVSSGIFFTHPTNTNIWQKYYPLKKINLENNSLEPVGIQHPSYFHNQCWNWMQTNIVYSLFDKNKIIYAFGASDELQVFDLNMNKVVKNELCFKSRFQTKISEPINCEATEGTNAQKTVKNRSINYAIEHDTFKDIFYAIKLLPTSDESIESLEPWWHLMMPFTVMAFDKEFKLIDEILLPEKTYNIYDFFVDEKGLWISKNNSLNPDASEDKLIYSLVELK